MQRVLLTCVYYKAVTPKQGVAMVTDAGYGELLSADELKKKELACELLGIPHMVSYVKRVEIQLLEKD